MSRIINAFSKCLIRAGLERATLSRHQALIGDGAELTARLGSSRAYHCVSVKTELNSYRNIPSIGYTAAKLTLRSPAVGCAVGDWADIESVASVDPPSLFSGCALRHAERRTCALHFRPWLQLPRIYDFLPGPHTVTVGECSCAYGGLFLNRYRHFT